MENVQQITFRIPIFFVVRKSINAANNDWRSPIELQEKERWTNDGVIVWKWMSVDNECEWNIPSDLNNKWKNQWKQMQNNRKK